MQDNSAPVMSESEPKQKGLKGLKTGNIIAIIFGTVAVLSIIIVAIGLFARMTNRPNGKYILTSITKKDSDEEMTGYTSTHSATINFGDNEKCSVYASDRDIFLILSNTVDDDDVRTHRDSECTYANNKLVLSEGLEDGLEYTYENGKVIVKANGFKLTFEKYYGTEPNNEVIEVTE